MNKLFYSIRYLLRNKGANSIKIVSLTLGLVVALLLFSKVAFEMSYDKFYPGKDRIYYLTTKWTINEASNAEEHRIINAPFAPTMNLELPEVESATVLTNGTNEVEFRMGDHKIVGQQAIADSLFFQTFGLPVVAGNILDMGKPLHAFISETFAKRAFGNEDPLGRRLPLSEEEFYTVAGVYKDIPKNSHLQMDVIVAFNTLYEFGYRPGWENNDAYNGYVKLAKGVDPKVVEAKIPDMMRRHYDVEAEIKEGIVREYFLRPVTDIHSKDPEVRRSCLILSLLGFALLFAAAMNYILMSISSLTKRAKAIGVHKCNGASNKDVSSMFLNETWMLILTSLIAAVLLIFTFRGPIEILIKSDLSAIFSLSNLWVTVLILLVLFVTTGVIPAKLFSSIPITQVFRTYTDSKRGWKKGLLFAQFTGITFMLSLLVIIMMQYHLIMNRDIGYETNQVIYAINVGNLTKEQMHTVKEELLRMPQIASITLANSMPLDRLSGSSVIDMETKQSLFTGRFMYADNDFTNAFNIPMAVGGGFRDENYADSREVIVNETLVRRLGIENPIGYQFEFMGLDRTICGVMKDYQTMGIYNDVFPVVVFPIGRMEWRPRLIARLNPVLSAELMSELDVRLRALTNNEESTFVSYRKTYDEYYYDTKLFRDSVIVATLIMLMISLLGLFGFVEDEILRRTKEIAVRKVNGALARDILELIMKGILYVALPSILLGVLFSYLVGMEWLQQFVIKIPLSVSMFTLCGIAILAVIQACVMVRSYSVATSNPVDYLKSE